MSEEIVQAAEETCLGETCLGETEQATQHQEAAPAAPEAPIPDINFKALRDSKERAERERDELYRRVQEMEQGRKKPAEPVPSEDENFRIAPDDFVEGKHLKKVEEKMRKMEEQIRNYQDKSSEMAIEATLKAQYRDFDKVVCKENIEALRAAHPEIAQTLNTSDDLYAKASSAYKLIKQFGIHKEDVFKEDRELAQNNSAKPRPLTSVSPQQGDSPLSKANAFANGLTDELKKQLLKEMNQARKGL